MKSMALVLPLLMGLNLRSSRLICIHIYELQLIPDCVLNPQGQLSKTRWDSPFDRHCLQLP